MRKVLLESVALVTIVTILASTYAGIATANVPTIISVENTSRVSGGYSTDEIAVYVKVTINHPGPSATHYIDWIEVHFMGETKQYQQTPQSSDSFSVELFWTVVAEFQLSSKPLAKVRAHCTVDGWSAWTSGTPIPEFPVVTIVAFTALATSLFILRSKPTIAQSRKARIKP